MRNLRSLGQSIKNLKFVILFNLILTYTIDEITNIVNVVTEKYTGKEGDKDNNESLVEVGRM